MSSPSFLSATPNGGYCALSGSSGGVANGVAHGGVAMLRRIGGERSGEGELLDRRCRGLGRLNDVLVGLLIIFSADKHHIDIASITYSPLHATTNQP